MRNNLRKGEGRPPLVPKIFRREEESPRCSHRYNPKEDVDFCHPGKQVDNLKLRRYRLGLLKPNLSRELVDVLSSSSVVDVHANIDIIYGDHIFILLNFELKIPPTRSIEGKTNKFP